MDLITHYLLCNNIHIYMFTQNSKQFSFHCLCFSGSNVSTCEYVIIIIYNEQVLKFSNQLKVKLSTWKIQNSFIWSFSSYLFLFFFYFYLSTFHYLFDRLLTLILVINRSNVDCVLCIVSLV